MDRLTTLIDRFRMRVVLAARGAGNLCVMQPEAGRQILVFTPEGWVEDTGAEGVGLALRVDWDGAHNPLVAALPQRVEVDLAEAPALASVLALLRQEREAHRCGAQSVVSSLGQVLMVRLLRHLIEAGTAAPGLLAGLADPRLARAIVAMHDAPGRSWTTSDLAQEAGLSLSRFSELFSAQMNETPMGYLRRWRLTLARQDLIRGDRVEAVARRYAYDSPEGFARAFRKFYGVAPVSLRQSTAA
ncbi:AraC family transcriptional regulator [Rhodobacteraceae bacterium R_SAG7]|jgi:AraC-like DNA-binding protein|uniref:helix-turn-helix transcriptional regulator n=1 Tax=Rhodobacterales TaxID=204455 RepID=UPI00004631C1|nr:AraC family transcriptional regulator [Ruegeria sp. TM1040]ABF64767.1 transcriptional regulator, AraC family [Ruegeria sp. TM1040]NKW78859.1 AraC family transcriptional regulator [Rhodobacteraceae bacterium R_SAG7]